VEEIDLGNGWSGCSLPSEPLEMPESKYSLLLAKGDDLRFFAWEFDDLTGTTVWYLCEWTPEHAHLNTDHAVMDRRNTSSNRRR
jgi:hypothetical protein